MITLTYPEFDVNIGFTPSALALECLKVLQRTEYSPEYPKNFPHASCRPSRNLPEQRCVGFFVGHDDLLESLENFSKRYIIPAMLVLRHNAGEFLELKEVSQELPPGVGFCANATVAGFGSARVIVMDEPIPAQPSSGSVIFPRGKIRRFFDINRDNFYNWEVCPVIRVDVIKDA